jgi:predicted HTH domain antitoxin
MSEKNDLVVKELPRNYYYNGHPDTVIDRVANLAKLNGNPELSEKRALMVREVLTFCPVPFLNELIEALETPNNATIELLINKASRGEINLKTDNSLSVEQKNQISALAFNLLVEKINSSDAKKLLPILYFVKEYISAQKAVELMSDREVMEIEKEVGELRKKIDLERDRLRETQQDLLLLFIKKLNNFNF